MDVKVSELELVLADLVKEVDGVKVIELDKLKEHLQSVLDAASQAGDSVMVAILPDGPPPGK